MDIVDQILGSQLSKQARTNPTGIFEGTPANVAGTVRQGVNVPVSVQPPPIQRPIDVTFNNISGTTYLEYLKNSNRL